MSVHITQCLCPDRHCIMAIVWREPEHTEESAKAHLKAIVDDLVEVHALNPWCGICKSRDFRYEDGITKFKSLKEALPFLQELENQQMQTMKIFAVERN